MKSCGFCKNGKTEIVSEKIKCKITHDLKNENDLCGNFIADKKKYKTKYRGGKK